MKYKPSKYNFYHKYKEELLLYNSYVGTDSLARVSSAKVVEVLNILRRGSDEETDIVRTLLKKGFLILEETDETLLKQCRIMKEVEDSTLHLIILPTEQCNFRCKYCYEKFEKGKMAKDVQNAIIKYIRKNLCKYTSLHVSWFGGEPLEALDVIEYLSHIFIQMCKTARKKYSASMTTNGYGLSLEVYEHLYSLGVHNYQITIDGLKDEHDKQRVLKNGEGTYATIIRNLINIKDKTNHRNTSIIIRTNFSKRIFSNIDEYLKFYVQTFGKDKRFNFYIHIASDWGGDSVEAFSDELLSKEQYRNILKCIMKYSSKMNFDTHFSHLSHQGCICYAAKRNSLVVGSDATLYKCTGDFEYEKNKVGMLLKNGDINLNQNYYLWLGGLKNDNFKCQECYYSACCLSNNCPAVRVRGLENDVCSFEKEHMGSFLELFNKSNFGVLE